jgi:hypothetical protein
MNECHTSDDNVEEDHRWFFSSPETLLAAERGMPAKGHADFLLNSGSDLISLVYVEKQQLFTLIFGNRDDFELISG